jgi:hypothetical protein
LDQSGAPFGDACSPAALIDAWALTRSPRRAAIAASFASAMGREWHLAIDWAVSRALDVPCLDLRLRDPRQDAFRFRRDSLWRVGGHRITLCEQAKSWRHERSVIEQRCQ